MYFRTDMNATIASGHVMRCIAIADAFRRLGEESTFVLSDDTAKEFLNERGYNSIILNTQWDDLENEIDDISKVIQCNSVERIIVDSYSATSRYLSMLNKLVSVTYIDDFCKCAYEVDRIIAYGNWISKEKIMSIYKNMSTELLIGTEYVPLRGEFKNVTGTHDVIDVLITTGGTDTYNVAGRLAEMLSGIRPQYKVTIVSSKLTGQCCGDNITICGNVSDMSLLMKSAALAVSAAGTTLFELCACAVPTVCFSFADNQVTFAQKMGNTCMEYVGDARDNTDIIDDIVDAVDKLMCDKNKRKFLSDRMISIVDGDGADRIVNKMNGVA